MATDTAYRNDDGSGEVTTSFGYSFYAGTNAVSQRATTWPVVATGQTWTLHVNVARVGFKYAPAIHSGRPIVLFTPTSHGGWRVQALHQRVRACRRLPK